MVEVVDKAKGKWPSIIGNVVVVDQQYFSEQVVAEVYR